MINNYWSLFNLSLIGTILFAIFIILELIFMKKIFLNKKYGIFGLIVSICLFSTLGVLCASKFVLCYKDYEYVSNKTYIEEKAKVVRFTESHFDYDGNGEVSYSKPKFYLIDKDEYIILNIKEVEIGKTYVIRYYPNTKVSDVLGEIN